jgi:peptide chain release factor 1
MNYKAILEILSGIEIKIGQLEQRMGDPKVLSDYQALSELSREHKRLSELSELKREYSNLIQQIADDEEVLLSEDEELVELAREELPILQNYEEKTRSKILGLLTPPDPNDGQPVIVEIRAGTGGREAALFVSDLFRMYSKYCEHEGWDLEVIDTNETDLGGYKEIVFEIRSLNVYRKMRFESGIHRVQRIPVTESSGRIHTSAASVAILPEVSDERIVIKDEELRVDTFRASGPGGQHVNKTDSAVRITHLPTGIVASSQAERSQHMNRALALRILTAKIAENERVKAETKRGAKRKLQVGSGDRSEKIRTYNFPQNRLTDHRIGYTSYNLQGIMEGDIGELFDKLQIAWVEEILSEFISKL